MAKVLFFDTIALDVDAITNICVNDRGKVDGLYVVEVSLRGRIEPLDVFCTPDRERAVLVWDMLLNTWIAGEGGFLMALDELLNATG